MSSIGDEIKFIILKALTSLSEDTQQQIITALVSSGVESIEDLKYVRQDDIRDFLPVIQQRKLLEAFKNVDTSLSSLSSPLPLSSSSSSSLSSFSPLSSSSQASSACNAIISSRWQETFVVPWDKMPEEVQSAIANGRRPAPDKRRQMIRVLVDEIRRYEANPVRNECLIICRNIVKQYPSSFADMTPGGVIIAGGFTSLLSQVKTRIENVNRAGTLKRHRSTRLSGQLQRPTDCYGCTQFQPEPPSEETNESVAQKQQQLENIYSQEGIHGGERAEVINLMKATFCLQRNQINQTPAPSIGDLRIQWPYLFTQRGIYCHFELLTDISVLRALELSIEECGRGMEKYLRTKAKNKDVGEDRELTLRVVQLLMAYFDERTEGLILIADMSATAADVERTLTLPASPRLILLVAGDEVPIGCWMISIESRVICEGIQPTFITGLATVFATYLCIQFAIPGGSCKDPGVCSKWLHKIRRTGFTITPHTKVCSRHFTKDQIRTTAKGRRFLTANAIPTLFEWNAYSNKTRAGVWERRTRPTSSPEPGPAETEEEIVDMVPMPIDHDYVVPDSMSDECGAPKHRPASCCCKRSTRTRRFIGINPERGTKASQGKVVSKKTGKLVQKKASIVNPHVATLLKKLMDFEWGFI
ncbi:THAP domain-containing protein 1 [Merluccius polli]|uniref:THAP domain-containing protein 1 n=1 Tax=Merluccius polli TaxID=89951 RepID=A0AA47M6R8_MERPO|nr:THAP domain-containing protein 1 [Merluccius polli]